MIMRTSKEQFVFVVELCFCDKWMVLWSVPLWWTSHPSRVYVLKYCNRLQAFGEWMDGYTVPGRGV